MLKNEHIIVVGQQPWDVDIGSNCKDIALEFSKNNKVLYVNPPLDRITSIRYAKHPAIIKRKQILKNPAEGLLRVNDNLFIFYPYCLVESVNWLKPYVLFDFLNKINNIRFASVIRETVKKLGYSDFILFNDNEIIKCFYLQEFLRPKLSIYYSRDYILGTPYWRRHGIISEPKMMAKVDLCFANSAFLMNYCKQYNVMSFDVGQGCNMANDALLAITDIPKDMEHIDGPIIGYVGSLQSIRLDIELLLHMAKAKPHWQIVLVGPEDEVFEKSRLHDCNNVHFLGRKEATELPSYISAFDLCINPQLVNPLTLGNYPRKIDEYLLFGKPVVAVNTEAMNLFKDYVYLAENHQDYIFQIEKALEEPFDENKVNARRAFAASHTWENSVERMYTVMQEELASNRVHNFKR